MKFRYYKGTKDSPETIELDVTESDGTYITTCVINVDLLLCGIKKFPCENGDDYTLEKGWYMEVLRFLRAEREKLLEGETIKSLNGWHRSGLRTFEEYCFPGDKVTEDIVESFINSVPPISTNPLCTQAGEAYSHEFDDDLNCYRPTYTTFHRVFDDKWVFDGYCFKGEIKSRRPPRNRIDKLIDEETRRSNAAAERSECILRQKG